MVEIVRLVIDHSGIRGLLLALTLLFLARFARAHPGRTLGQVVSTEIRRRYLQYLKSRGVPDAELQRLLREIWTDDGPKSEPPANGLRGVATDLNTRQSQLGTGFGDLVIIRRPDDAT